MCIKLFYLLILHLSHMIMLCSCRYLQYGKCIAFLKAGQKNWTYIDNIHCLFNDIIFYKGLVYAIGTMK